MPTPTRAVLLDALGTLVELEPPAERLRIALGGDLPPKVVERAMRAEMAYYRTHSHEARDESSLAELRERCAALLERELGREVPVATMMSAIRFRAYDDAAGALDGLRRRGLALVCVSNWDCRLPQVLAEVGLADLLDGVVASATAGARKPEPAIFEAALGIAGCEAAESLAVGDTVEEDVAGARAAGIPALLLDRAEARGSDPSAEGSDPLSAVATISSLEQISDHLSR